MYNMRMKNQYLVIFDEKWNTIFQLNTVDGGMNVAQRIIIDDKATVDFWHLVQRDIGYLKKTCITAKKKEIAKLMLKGRYVQPNEWPHTNHPDFNWHETQPIHVEPINPLPVNPQVYPSPGVPLTDNTWDIGPVSYPAGSTWDVNSGSNPRVMTTTDGTTWTAANPVTVDSSSGDGIVMTTDSTTGGGVLSTTTAPVSADVTYQWSGASGSTRIDNFTFENEIRISGKRKAFDHDAMKNYLCIDMATMKVKTDLKDPVKCFYDTLLNMFFFDNIFKYYPGMKELK